MTEIVDRSLSPALPDTEWEALRVHLLGSFRVATASRVLEEGQWRLRKAAALIKLLALAPGHRLHREQILDQLWPELDPRSAANNLHQVLHAVRRLLEVEGSDSRYLRFQHGQLLLAPGGSIWVDVEAFESAAATAQRTHDPADYHLALRLYSGDLLPADLYEDWAAGRREDLRQIYLALCLELAGSHEEQGSLGPAIEALQLAVRREPALEDAQASLMRLYARAGQRHQALRQYELLKTALEEDLDLEPDAATQALYQDILAGNVPVAERPALHAVPRRRHNLPSLLTGFVGRRREITMVKELLGRTRLLTLTGTGGSGKTRLAIEVGGELAEDYPDGVWLIELASLSDPTLVAQGVAQALTVREEPGRPLLDSLLDALRARQLLLILDNCEHLIEACAYLAHRLLHACPQVVILATSREPLGVNGEVRWQVPPLPFPDLQDRPSLETLAACEAVQLFVERARYRQPGFALSEGNIRAVAQICQRLEGIPLAIELATARVSVLSVEQIASRLDDALTLLSAGGRTAEPRQQTLRGTLDWSYDLLRKPDRRLFERLSVFAGGWTLEGARAVDSDAPGMAVDVLEPLSRMVDQSLVTAEAGADGTLRYRMLEPIRQYARERLTRSGEADTIQRRHAALLLKVAEEAYPGMMGPDSAVWLERLTTEHANILAALQWCASEHGDAAMGLRLVGNMWPLWTSRGNMEEGRRWLDTALELGGDARPTDRAAALYGLSTVAYWQRDYDRTVACGGEGLSLYWQLQDRRGAANCLVMLGLAALERGDLQQATDQFEEALELYRQVGDRFGAGEALCNIGVVARELGELVWARAAYEESLVIFRDLGERVSLAAILANVGAVARDQGEEAYALACFREALGVNQELKLQRQLIYCLEGIAFTVSQQGQMEQAARLLGAAEALREAWSHPQEAHLTKAYEPYVQRVRTALGEESYNARVIEGRSLSLEEAITWAMVESEGENSL